MARRNLFFVRNNIEFARVERAVLSTDLSNRAGQRELLGDDYFTGRNERNVIAISNEIEDKMIEAGVKTIRREGRAEGRWILLDFGDLVVHVFHEEERLYYGLERLWKDCPVVSLT